MTVGSELGYNVGKVVGRCDGETVGCLDDNCNKDGDTLDDIEGAEDIGEDGPDDGMNKDDSVGPIDGVHDGADDGEVLEKVGMELGMKLS